LRFDLSAIDRSGDPCDDFYAYACGGWLATHPIPPEKDRISRYDEMVDRNESWTHELLQAAADDQRMRSPLEQQVGDDYAACLDQKAIDARGLAPLEKDIAALDGNLRTGDWATILARLNAEGVNAPFNTYVDADIRSPARTLLQIDTGGIGLSDRDGYLREDERSKALRNAYRLYLRRVFNLLGEPSEKADRDAARVMELETALARASPDSLTRRSREAQYHLMSIQDLDRRAPAIAWREYFKRLGVPTSELIVNVTAPAFLDAVQTLITASDRQAWRALLVWHSVRRSTEVLPSPFAEAAFDFYGKTARGIREMAPRWRRCGRLVDGHLGEAVGQLFVREHFPPQTREKVLGTIESVRTALREAISSNSWMSEPTRREALVKVDSIQVKIGHPDRWRDYSGLAIDRSDAYGNAKRARVFEMRRQVSKLGAPTDRAEWDSLPQRLDGYSTKVLNEIAFTAGILQRPFFDPSSDRPLQFGALGAVAGHELIHLFDDEGRKFDSRGAVRDWWAPDDARRYAELAQCFVDEYAREIAIGDLHVNGRLTLGENLADNGGLRLAFRAAHLRPDEPEIDGFTSTQRLFLAWAQIRCENATEATMRLRTQTDGHSPGRLRVNVVVSNMAEFASAFQCAPTAAMARADRCVLW